MAGYTYKVVSCRTTTGTLHYRIMASPTVTPTGAKSNISRKLVSSTAHWINVQGSYEGPLVGTIFTANDTENQTFMAKNHEQRFLFVDLNRSFIQPRQENSGDEWFIAPLV
ncbi:hypothetical protein NE237_019938 [Protea cynaroides]|uniref:Uncharacterized protein n=1 Tax=Protea cynaroides TaxID=273540 RepID=A0A9Q0H5P3_9MAGN|nr:hypothetical protein NE237_019938 [Protea cynaroides]